MHSILFVSGDEAARERWRQALERRGGRVVTIAPGCGAPAAAAEDLDAIVVDVEAAVDWRYLREFAETRPRQCAWS